MDKQELFSKYGIRDIEDHETMKEIDRHYDLHLERDKRKGKVTKYYAIWNGSVHYYTQEYLDSKTVVDVSEYILLNTFYFCV